MTVLTIAELLLDTAARAGAELPPLPSSAQTDLAEGWDPSSDLSDASMYAGDASSEEESAADYSADATTDYSDAADEYSAASDDLSAGEEGCVVKEAQVAEGHGGEAVRIGVCFGDDGILGPVEVDFAEPAAFGDERCECGGRFVDDLCLIVAGHCVVEGVCARDLVRLRHFDYGLPTERIDGVRVRCHSKNRRAV